ncbi:MAG: glutamate synthase [Clostridia bacterium]|nr:glutamate synthase [Clostridia bacterium]
MRRFELKTVSDAQRVADGLYQDMERRLASTPEGICPVDLMLGLVTMCHTQSCGKCVPCRVGLGQLENLLRDVLNGKATMETIDLIEQTAEAIKDSADCAIGYDAARMVGNSVKAFRDDFVEHVTKHRCLGGFESPVPCVAMCPANVDIPGYIALINEGRNEDAVKLIRKDNPFPVTCAYICEHPCENRCRRRMLDDAINIRGLKRYAVDNVIGVPVPECAPATGKTVAVIGGGPCGLTAAYFLSLMGHKVSVFERQKLLGGMLRYGIPAYRFPRGLLDRDINAILATGVEAKCEAGIEDEAALKEVVDKFDCVYVSVGAHAAGRARIKGEDLNGVVSAIGLLRGIGDEEYPDMRGKTVAVIGGGNVAMDVTRTAIRLGAEKVYCVYRRRQRDMTAQPEELEGAMAEGAELLTLKAPAWIEGDENGNAAALWVKPQIPGMIDASGRPAPVPANLPEERIAADIIIVAVGQKVETEVYKDAGFQTGRDGLITAPGGRMAPDSKVFAGGECVTGPVTAIRAIAAGKAMAASIDEYLGFHHDISVDVAVPLAPVENKPSRGRINTHERMAFDRKCDFECIECGITEEGAAIESSRCLRCDYYGYGAFKGGRKSQW